MEGVEGEPDVQNKISRRDSESTIIYDPNEYADVSTGQTGSLKRQVRIKWLWHFYSF